MIEGAIEYKLIIQIIRILKYPYSSSKNCPLYCLCKVDDYSKIKAMGVNVYIYLCTIKIIWTCQNVPEQFFVRILSKHSSTKII